MTEFQNEKDKFNEGNFMKWVQIYMKAQKKNGEKDEYRKKLTTLVDKAGDSAITRKRNPEERTNPTAKINTANNEVGKIKEKPT